MGIEIERKFLVKDISWRTAADEGVECRQGYLLSSKKATVRVRIIGDRAFLTIKGETTGITRSEFEHEIPVPEAEALLVLCGGEVVEKIRYSIEHGGMAWVLDVFRGENEGLVMAEIELDAEHQLFEIPPWTGREVSDDPRYFNSRLARHPFSAFEA